VIKSLRYVDIWRGIEIIGGMFRGEQECQRDRKSVPLKSRRVCRKRDVEEARRAENVMLKKRVAPKKHVAPKT